MRSCGCSTIEDCRYCDCACHDGASPCDRPYVDDAEDGAGIPARRAE